MAESSVLVERRLQLAPGVVAVAAAAAAVAADDAVAVAPGAAGCLRELGEPAPMPPHLHDFCSPR